MLGSPRTEESDEAEEAVVDEFAQRVLAASAEADVKAAGAAQKAADASQAMHATAAAVRQTHADLTDFQERHARALDAIKAKVVGNIMLEQYMRRQ